MATIIIMVRPCSNRLGYSEAYVADGCGDRLCVSRQPLLDSARVLLECGIDPATILFKRREGSDMDLLTSTVGAAAKLTVEESDRGPIFRRWRPASRAVEEPPH